LWQVERLVALGLISLWGLWWVESARRDVLVCGAWTTVPALTFLAGDFKAHIDHVARIAAAGIDPYRKTGDFFCELYPYPPMIARAFSWVTWFDSRTASLVWLSVLALIFVTAGVWAGRVRRALGLVAFPSAVAVAAVLFSTPALLAMERGQCDPIVIPALLLAAWLLNHRRRGAFWFEIAAGGLLGVTAWIKYYPGVAAVALVALGRRRGLAAFVVVAGLIGVVDRDGVIQSIRNGQKVHVVLGDKIPIVHGTKHSIVENWPRLGVVRRDGLARRVPGAWAAAAVLIPAIFGVSRAMARASVSAPRPGPGPGPLIGPYLLWLAVAATFGMPYALDYNLVPLVVVILAVYDRRDRWPARVVVGLSLLAWEPIRAPVGGEILFVLKVAALLASGACLAARAAERAATTEPPRAGNASHVFRPRLASKHTAPTPPRDQVRGPASGCVDGFATEFRRPSQP
jgi:hypothetical protein